MNSPTFQLVEVDLIPTVGITTTLTKSQNKNQVLISSLRKHFNVEIHKIYKNILPEKNLAPESWVKAGLIQLEKYDNRFHRNRPDSIIEVYVPIEMIAPGVPP